MAKILVIDDDPDVRTMMAIMLHKEGYEVNTAGGREEALEILNEVRPSVILLDVLLSGEDGRELCREIKQNESLKHIPVIMLSGHPGAASKFEAYGANDFIGKPFNSQELLDKLNRVITN